MSDTAIRVEKLGKSYRIGTHQPGYKTIRDVITGAVVSPFKKARSLMRGQAYGASSLTEEMWALRDLSFEVKHGEVVGIIGRNGAGKSTLLKILSRITDPTVGYADVYGRVGALLEVGTGFHPELTGRENIYLNGTILGMGRKEIDRKFDEIVDFSGVDKFIDTPVKHYSSGMGLRLGFAIAAHLEPEILVIDEVLAVGDAEFQKKCLGKMSDVAGEGRTVLFVSHNMTAVQALCSSCVLLQEGQIANIGPTRQIIDEYVQGIHTALEVSLDERKDRIGNGDLVFNAFRVLDGAFQAIDNIRCGQSIYFELGFHVNLESSLHNVVFQINISDSDDRVIAQLMTKHTGQNFETIEQNDFIRCKIPFLPLLPGLYYLTIAAKYPPNDYLDGIKHAVTINVIPDNVLGGAIIPGSNAGVVVIPHTWTKNSQLG